MIFDFFLYKKDLKADKDLYNSQTDSYKIQAKIFSLSLKNSEVSSDESSNDESSSDENLSDD